MSDDKYLIWWTSEQDCKRIEYFGLGDLLNDWPAYLRTEFISRNGRNARARLWISEKLKDAPEEVSVKWSNAIPGCCAAADAGGIVVRSIDARHVQFLPGFITTFDMMPPRS